MAQTNLYYTSRQEQTESSARSYPRKFPFALNKAQGSWVEDVEGNKYLDFLWEQHVNAMFPIVQRLFVF